MHIGGRYDRSFGWNFCSWYDKRSIEFRKPPACKTSQEALSWAELAMSFVQASTRFESSQELQSIPPTIGGLRWFLRHFANDIGVNQPSRLDRLWRGKDPEAILEPEPQILGFPERERLELEAMLGSLVLADRRRSNMLMKAARGKYR